MTHLLILLVLPIAQLVFFPHSNSGSQLFHIEEATVTEIQLAFHQNKITSAKLVKIYLRQISKLNPTLRSVIELNPDALDQAKKADEERKYYRVNGHSSTQECTGALGPLHGIPVLVKDNIGTFDKLNTSCGCYALVGSVLGRDSGVAKRLRDVGAVILGKASMSEWAHFRSFEIPDGWCARTGQGRNPYNLSSPTCGSSSGSAISVTANMVTVSLGTETDGSILCPANYIGVVGIKPTVGLTSRSGVIPISPRQDTVGPICRTVEDAVHVLDAIVGFDPYDAKATRAGSKYIPKDGGYAQFLKLDGLKGKRIGLIRNPFFNFRKESGQGSVFKMHLQVLRNRGAVLLDNIEIPNIDQIMDYSSSGSSTALVAEFKSALNSYLKGLVSSPVRSLKEVIRFNNVHKELEMIEEYGQQVFLMAESTNGTNNDEVRKAKENLRRLSKEGLEKIMTEYKLDAILTPGSHISTVLAIGGFPGITVPAGYNRDNGQPFGVCFGGLKGYEPRLIEIAYAFEQATRVRRPPPPLP